MSKEKIKFLEKNVNVTDILSELDDNILKRIRKIKLKEAIVTPSGRESSRSHLITKEEFMEILSKQKDKVLVKEIILEDQTDLMEGIKKLRETVKTEFTTILKKYQSLYELEIERISNAMNHLESFKQFLKDSELKEFSVQNDNRGVWLIKTFETPVEVNSGISQSGSGNSYKRKLYIFDKPICHIKKVALNILHKTIVETTMKLSMSGAHPNVHRSSGSEALTNPCSGNLLGRVIDLADPKKVVHLVDEITKTYMYAHLDSTFWDPRNGFNGTNWSVTEEKDITKRMWR